MENKNNQPKYSLTRQEFVDIWSLLGDIEFKKVARIVQIFQEVEQRTMTEQRAREAIAAKTKIEAEPSA